MHLAQAQSSISDTLAGIGAGSERNSKRKIPLSSPLPRSVRLMSAVMVLLEHIGCSLEKLFGRVDRRADPRCRCLIYHHSSSSHEVAFVT